MSDPVALTGGYLHWLVANDYYDGEVAGVGLRASDGSHVWFCAIAWDSEQWQRVFAVARVEKNLVDKLVAELESVENRRVPFWAPGRATGTPEAQDLWREVINAALDAVDWRLVEGHSLLEETTELVLESQEVPGIVRAARSGALMEEFDSPLMGRVLRRIRDGG